MAERRAVRRSVAGAEEAEVRILAEQAFHEAWAGVAAAVKAAAGAQVGVAVDVAVFAVSSAAPPQVVSGNLDMVRRLTPKDREILALIYEPNNVGRIRITPEGCVRGGFWVDKATASRHLARLEDMGLLHRIAAGTWTTVDSWDPAEVVAAAKTS